jgi:hypothetical protein
MIKLSLRISIFLKTIQKYKFQYNNPLITKEHEKAINSVGTALENSLLFLV